MLIPASNNAGLDLMPQRATVIAGLRGLFNNNRKNRPALIRQLYLVILSRYPTPAELTAAAEYFDTVGLRPDQAVNDLAWALINSKEFLYRH